jgi:hypothetical protein
MPSFTTVVTFSIGPSPGFLCQGGSFNALDELMAEVDSGARCAVLVLPFGGREVQWGQVTGGEAGGYGGGCELSHGVSEPFFLFDSGLNPVV